MPDSVMPNYVMPDSCFDETSLCLIPLYPIPLYLIPLLHVMPNSVVPGSPKPLNLARTQGTKGGCVALVLQLSPNCKQGGPSLHKIKIGEALPFFPELEPPAEVEEAAEG